MGAFETRLAAGYRGTCTTCLGLGCNDCCHTGAAPQKLDTPKRDVSHGCDTVPGKASTDLRLSRTSTGEEPMTDADDETRAGSEERQGGAMTPTEAIMAALDEMTSLYGPCLMDDEDWSDGFLAALPPGWRLCGPDDVTVTVDGLAEALNNLDGWGHWGGTGEETLAERILDALSADKEGQK